MNSGKRNMSETTVQRQLLVTAVGTPGSGVTRYAAAMYFFQIGRISAEMLEIYRRCSKLDAEDPLDLARYEGVSIAELTCVLNRHTDA